MSMPALFKGRLSIPVIGSPLFIISVPDLVIAQCKAGADKLCQSKGYKEGKSLDISSAEKCSPKVYMPGYKRQPGDCRTENFVTRAVCQ